MFIVIDREFGGPTNIVAIADSREKAIQLAKQYCENNDYDMQYWDENDDTLFETEYGDVYFMKVEMNQILSSY